MSITTVDILRLVQDGKLSPPQAAELMALSAGRQAAADAPETTAAPAVDPGATHAPCDVAIIGMAGRFPGADDIETFWNNLAAGRDSVTPIPPSRWDLAGFYDPDRGATNRSYSKWAGLVDDIAGFDADFFNISPREALLMDPQQRLFLQEAWRAIEHAGYAPDSWGERRCGAFVGCVTGDYQTHLREAEVPIDAYSLTGNTGSILAARLSYFLNLKGPAVAVDTACSSALVAVHLACESLASGSSDVALAGGVMLFSTPELFVQASRLGMLSPDGVCKTFDNAANGIVLSETVGAVVLKRLADAERDGDTIHAVIRGSGLNQDGKTPGITVPSAYAQAALIEQVQARAGIDAQTIGYIEAHGTGTRLGDPIELDALGTVFGRAGTPKQSCAIGSVKTNIGHAQIAAGITSLIKAVQCLRYRQLPPSLHLEEPNQLIDFANSPFRLVTALESWPANPAFPRRAGVTSLGFSGTNAHLLLEEYPQPAPRSAAGAGPAEQLAVLSARTPERLRAQARRLLDWRGSPECAAAQPALLDVVHTLQLGRSAMAARLAIVCRDYAGLEAGLRAFLDERADATVLSGMAAAPGTARGGIAVPRVARDAPAASLAEAWVRGAPIDWRGLYDGLAPRRVPLPGYAFASELYWPQGPGRAAAAPASRAAGLVPRAAPEGSPPTGLHPLLSLDLSMPGKPRFGHRFTGDEVYLKDHIVSGAPTLLGVSHLEMAIAAEAISRAARGDAQAGAPGTLVQVHGVAWLRPLIVTDRPKPMQIELEATARGLVYRVAGRDEAAAESYSQGCIRFVPAPAQAPRLDLEAVKARCSRVWEAAECYRIFDRNELIYGPGLRTLETLRWNPAESLARLVLPEALRACLPAYTLHPSLMDGALQSLLGLLGDPSADGRLYIPYALGEITVHAPLGASCYAHARVAGNHASSEFAERRFDIDIVADDGRVLAELRDLSYRPYSRRKPAAPHRFAPAWRVAALAAAGDEASEAVAGTQTLVVAARRQTAQLLAAGLEGAAPQLIGVLDESGTRGEPDWRALAARLAVGLPARLVLAADAWPTDGAAVPASLYALLAALRERGIERGRLLFLAYPAAPMAGAAQRALAGFARVLRREQPGWIASVLVTPAQPPELASAAIARELAHRPAAGEVLARLRDGRRELEILEALAPPTGTASRGLFRDEGVYLITGGAGALGLRIAAELQRRYRARIVACGRSAPEAVAAAIEAAGLAALPGAFRYVQADLAEQADVERLCAFTRASFGPIHGVLHAAGAIRDSLIAKQDPAALGAVIDPKVRGAGWLDAATREDPLDLMVLFASISSLAGTVGQGAYAYANAWLDQFAAWRDTLVASGQRRGRTIAIDWPYWRDGGMRIGEAGETLMRKAMGVEPLTLEQGMAVLFGLSAEDPASFCVAAGDAAKIAKTIYAVPPVPVHAAAGVAPAARASAPLPAPSAAPADAALAALAESIVRRAPGTVRAEVPLADYGFDSITFVELANRINQAYELDVTPALFFEHRSIAAIAAHLREAHGLDDVRAMPPEAARRPRAALETVLRELAAGVLARDAARFAAAVPLADYGFDSITYVELANALNTRFDLDVTPTLFFEHRTLDALAGWLADTHGAAVSAALAAQAGTVSMADASRAAGSASEQAASTSAPVPAAGHAPPADTDPIAIVGMAGVLPGSVDLEQFWAHLEAGHDLISEVPADRWRWQDLYGEPAEGRTRAKWGGFMAEIDKFDSLYFNISPHEAKLMDPAQRIALEVVCHAIAHAGYAHAELAGSRTAVYLGVGAPDYLNLLVESGQKVGAYSSTGLAHSVLVNRISYLLDLRGPSQPIDTACSSSLVALHRAVAAIRHHGCEMAIAGGVNVIASPFLTLSFSDAGMLSEDGRCKTFSRAANGYVRGEGAGAVVLKRLSRALADGDTIHAVIRATAENHSGRTSSLTAPNPVAQAELLVQAYSEACIDPSTVTYLETHGTGTPLGDPIEVNGIKSAFAELARRHPDEAHAHRCGIGSVKTNLGHLEAAAGMAGLFKILLAMRHRMLPPNLHFDQVNPYLRLDGSPFFVVDRLQPWEALRDRQGRPVPRRAGISSLSFSGVNAHAVLEEYLDERPATAPRGDELIVLSARNRERLHETMRRLASHLDANPALALADIAHTLRLGRDALADRVAIVTDSVAALANCLRDALAGRPASAGRVWFSRDALADDQAGPAAAAGDAEHAARIDAALAGGDLPTLAEGWTGRADLAIDWRGLRQPAFARRVPLPGYPFARVRHWAFDAPPSGGPGPALQDAAGSPRAAIRPSVAAAGSRAADASLAAQAGSPDAHESSASTAPAIVAVTESWRPAAAPAPLAGAASTPRTVLCCLSHPDWQAQLTALAAERMPGARLVFVAREGFAPVGAQGHRVAADAAAQLAALARTLAATHGAIDGLLYLWPLEAPALSKAPEQFAGMLRALCADGRHPARAMAALACRSAAERTAAEAWIGFERSSRAVLPDTELSALIVEAAEHDDARSMRQMLEPVLTEWLAPSAGSASYEGGERRVLVRERVALPALDPRAAPPSARARVWFITGGAGHLGLLFAAHLARTHGAAVRIALTGRSPADAALEARLDELRAHGAQLRYFPADVTDHSAMATALQAARDTFGPLEAVIHAAGVEEGASLLEADAAEFRRVIAAKQAGADILDVLCADDPLVYLCHFGSIAALIGDLGAASYSVANRFLMAHAAHRNQRAARRERRGRSLCLGWPLWRDGGMGPVRASAGSASAEALARYLASRGMALLEADAGLALFEAALGADIEQLAFLAGDAARIERLLALAPAAADSASPAGPRAAQALHGGPDTASVRIDSPPYVSDPMDSVSAPDPRALARAVLAELKTLASALSQIPVDELGANAELNAYGFDSIGLARLAKAMQAHFGLPVTPAMFFSHPTLGRIASHLAAAHGDALLARQAAGADTHEAVAPAAADPAASAAVPTTSTRPDAAAAARDDTVASGPRALEPIAIIGASGRFPQADSIDEMWQWLREGREAVSDTGAPAGYRCGSLRGAGEFDPLFFDISPRAAEEMDPRQRLLLEEAWRALEDAAIGPQQLAARRAGVFVGLEEGEYFRLGGGGAITAHHAAITASHLAYLLDFHGPVMTLNTACSSGLVALHQACQSLRLGECDLALVGSVHLMLTTESYTRLGEAGMLSPEGRCLTFDEGANGMVPGEAVAALVVKRLAAALEDGDPILAVVAGSGINYDGKTNGITAPSGAAQVRLLRDTYAASGLAPRQIDYVVTHGTATSLGDAVEVNALAEVFGKSDDGPHCALSSTKTNFGHTLAVSGLLSALSLVSALRHGTIPPSLHFSTPNAYIDWRDSALFVNREARAWPARADRARHGGVSAFGMSGTNAHAVIRDLTAAEQRAPQRFAAGHASLLVLSARSLASLAARARQLLEVLGRADAPELAALAYTLFEGRHHFEYRCAIVATDRTEAAALLARLLAERLEPASERSRSSDALSAEVFGEHAFIGRHDGREPAQPAIEEAVERLVRQLGDDLAGDPPPPGQPAVLRALADFYRQGYPIAWRLRYRGSLPDRLALPTYPFDRQHYWVKAAAEPAAAPQAGAMPSRVDPAPAAPLHPLLHARRADTASPVFVSTFTGRERVLADHVIQGRPILPGVAYLEMALAAALRALPPSRRASLRGASLGKIGWTTPFAADAQVARVLETRLEMLEPASAGAFAFTIASRPAGDAAAADTVHCQGVVTLAAPLPAAAPLELEAVRARCARRLDAAACYAAFAAAGLAYGEGCRALDTVWAGDDECLALLCLPAVLSEDTLERGDAAALDGTPAHVLHPALVDGALQAVAGWFLRAPGDVLPSRVPFALDRVEVFGPTTACMWARLSVSGEGAMRKLDAQLYDQDGGLRVRLTGLSAREIGSPDPAGTGSHAKRGEPILLACDWRDTLAEAAGTSATAARRDGTTPRRELLVLAANGEVEVLAEAARAVLGVMARVLAIELTGHDALAQADAFGRAATALFERVRALLAEGAGQAGVLLQVVALGWPDGPGVLALDAMLKTAALENPRFSAWMLAAPSLDAAALHEISRAADDPSRRAVWLDGRRRRLADWRRLDAAPARPAWRDGGVYLVTGGAGSIGRLLARDILAAAPAARVVLSGRSAADAALAAPGARVEYRQADVSHPEQARALVEAILAAHGRLDGVIHSAGLAEDNFVINKAPDELQRVFAPKVRGVAALDLATRDLALDLFVLCASASGVTGNVGQADYAAANAYLDGFAHARNALVARGARRGQTLAVDWSLWADGGMRPDPQTEARLASELGVRPLATDTALAALHLGLREGVTQMLVAEGDPSLALARFGLAAAAGGAATHAPKGSPAALPAAASLADTSRAAAAPADLLGATIDYFKQLLADVFGLPPYRIHGHEALERYGIDSVMVVRLTSKLEAVFGPLSKTLFFEYRTLGALCAYFVAQHGPRLTALLGDLKGDIEPAAGPAAPAEPAAIGRADSAAAAGAYAIVGLAGRYPQAPELDTFWANLRAGRDSITEIPRERWNHDPYFAPGAFQAGKTNGRWGGFIDGVDQFDTVFFQISPREAEVLDPQERLFLQTAWHALEDAGYTRASIAAASRRAMTRRGIDAGAFEGAAVGVFVGAMYNEYQLYGAEQTALGRPLAIPGNVASIANRVSYFCDFQGPSLTLDTMCSSSLSAIHLACQSIAAGECAFAIAGGVNVSVHPNKYLVLGQGRFLAEDGRCRSFGEGGSGYVPGEGVGAVLIRPLADALADGDAIHAVIAGSALNHGGKTNGYSVPNPNAQAALIGDALRRAAVAPEAIGYVEAHGTGTALGDPIEIAGLTRAFAGRGSEARCPIGSVKSNIGHAESAAGIAGLSKIVLQMRHRTLAPSLHAASLNPNIDFSRTPFVVQREAADWPALAGGARVAAISSFGAGGSNAHLIVREHVEPPASGAPASAGGTATRWLVPLSARTGRQLLEKIEQLIAMLEAASAMPPELAGIAHTLQVGREAMRERLAFAAASPEQLLRRLRAARDGWARIEAELAALGAGAVLASRVTGEATVLYRAKASAEAAGMADMLDMADHDAVARAWVAGAGIDWERDRAGPAPRRVRLPLYPFARERYWAPVETQSLIAASAAIAGGRADAEAGGVAAPDACSQAEAGTALLVPGWRAAARPAPDTAAAVAGGALLILATPATLELARRLFARSGTAVDRLLLHGDGAAEAGALEIDLERADSGRAAWQAVSARLAGAPLGLIDLSGLDPERAGPAAPELGKLALLQGLLAAHRGQRPALLQITRGLAGWPGAATLHGARAAGLYRMLSAEYRSVRSGTLDLDAAPASIETLVERIEQEFLAGPVPACCYRDGERFEPALERLERAAGAGTPYRADEVVLVTGGTGGIGAALVEHLAASGVRAIGIVGRERLPAPADWPARIAAGTAGGLSARTLDKLTRLQALVARGVRVAYAACALDGETEVRAAHDRLAAELGAFSGVFHCAGLTGADPAFLRQPAEQIAAVCAPKMAGLAALHGSVAGPRLRFFLAFSSVSALVPRLAAGQADYAMANAYMDAYARASHARGDTRLRSLQWPAWGETGMAVGTSMPAFGRSGLKPIPTAAGLALVDRCVAEALRGEGPAVLLPCCIDADFDASALLAPLPEESRPVQAAPAAAVATAATVASTAAEPAASREHLLGATLDWLRTMLIDELKFTAEQVADPDAPFSDYGIESVMVLQLVSRMSELTGARLDPSVMLEHTTLGALGAHLLAGHAPALASRFGAAPDARQDGAPAGDAGGDGGADQGGLAVPAAAATPAPAAMPTAPTAPTGRDDIAIVGLAVRLPGAADLDAFWQLQTSGGVAITPMRDARWPTGEAPVHAGWLDDIDAFDAAHFGLHASDVAVMDPQARLMLEESLHAFCDAGYAAKELSGRAVGVYVGGRLQVVADAPGLAAAAHPILGVGQNYLASNISRAFNLSGPSLVVDTACSSGLTALSLASDALRGGRIEMALVGATSLLGNSQAHDLFAARNILSPDGVFRIFERDAAGDVLGEGVVAVVCKTLERARADGDRILAVLGALAVNNDGRTLGPGSPSLNAQREVMRRALDAAGRRVEEIGYIEVNGGGSAVVDAVEIKALSQVYRLDDTTLAPCSLGSLKPSVGHLLLSSGLAGFARCLLSVARGEIAPSRCATAPFDHYDFGASRARFDRAPRAWAGSAAAPRVAAQSCFPDGGTNCHAIVEQFVPDAAYVQRRQPLPLPVLQRRRYARSAPTAPVAAASRAAAAVLSQIQSSWGMIHEKSI
ncbi:SDR family NAD(P)-dependent oxidoreductase [Burkholderia alba]|uniref:SDR family NAD(P)-dependent oxidoreductase n=1 Tax=Burkholderia alba TaxID=2683677 RepID=UPI002B0592F5|nr:SDR family NAD(P)-dependent oxidoreductase [Burkholderia alba]